MTLDEKIQLLPHHVDRFTKLYFKKSEERTRLFEMFETDYSDSFISNIEKIFEDFILNPHSNRGIEIVLMKPDSLCMPEAAKACKECFMETGYDAETEERIFGNGLYKAEYCERVLLEMRLLLFYQDLKPGKTYSCDHFKRITENTGKKLLSLQRNMTDVPRDIPPDAAYTPSTEIYSPFGRLPADCSKEFPLVSKFMESNFYKSCIQLLVRGFLDITDDGRIDRGNILFERFPILFSQNSAEIYETIIKTINSEK